MDISQDPGDSRSDVIIALIGSPGLKPDFGSGLWDGVPIGIPFILVCGSQSEIPLTFRANDYDANYGNESYPGPYPIPLSAPVEGNGAGDSHVLTVDIDNKIKMKFIMPVHEFTPGNFFRSDISENKLYKACRLDIS